MEKVRKGTKVKKILDGKILEKLLILKK